MNWTGGGVQRHATTNPKNIAVQRQKQHFARAQQNLRTGGIVRKSSPVKFSVFGIDIRDRDRLDQKVSPIKYSSSINGDRQLQRSRNGLASTAHLPPPDTRAGPTKRSHEHESRRPQRPPIKRESSRVLEDDLYNATPPPRPGKRKRNDLPTETDMIVSPRREDKESLSEIKKRLLRRGDWVGVGIQKPLQLAFGSFNNNDNIGRRRQVADGQKAKYSSAQGHIVSPFAARTRLPERYHDDLRQPPRAHPSIPDVRISIGGRTVPPGVSSSVRNYRGPSASERRSSQAVSSEVLLLGNESARDPYNEKSRAPSERSEESSLLLQSSSRAASHHHPDTASQHSQSQQAFAGNHTSSQRFLGVQDHKWAGVTADSLVKLQRNFHRLPTLDNNASRRPHGNIVPSDDLRRSLRSGREVFSSSSASLHYPKPQTSRRSVLLREDSSQLAESDVAQLGNQEPLVSSSQLLQNSIWRDWVAPRSEDQEDNEGLLDILETEFACAGPSMSPPARLPNRFTPREDVYSSELEEPLLLDELQGGHDNVFEFPDDDNITEQGNGKGHDEFEEDSVEATNLETSSMLNGMPVQKDGPSDYGGSILDSMLGATNFPRSDPPVRNPHQELPPVEPQISSQPAEDPDEVWRKFVFGSSDKPESFNPRSAEQIDSMVAHPSSRQDIDGDFQSASPRQKLSDLSHFYSLPANSHHSNDMAQPGLQRSSPPGYQRTSMDAYNGSAFPSSSELAPTTMAVHARSPLSTSYTPQRIIFSKPKPFIGRKSKTGVQPDEEPLYIGRAQRGNHEQHSAGVRRKRRSESNFADTDEQDELESIEDD